MLCNSTLRDAVLQGADFSSVNLQGAYYTEEQLVTTRGSWSVVR